MLDPQKLVLDLGSLKQEAHGYVMLSRPQNIEQLFIVDELPTEKIRPNRAALKEVRRMEKQSLNENLPCWYTSNGLKIAYFNVKSLSAHFNDVKNWQKLKLADIICIVETWLYPNDVRQHLFCLDKFKPHFVNAGRGKGIAVYYKADIFRHVQDFTADDYQLCKLGNETIDVIVVYRSSSNNQLACSQHLLKLITKEKTLIVGDFNLKTSQPSSLRNNIISQGFEQLIKTPTFKDGSSIDHVYVRSIDSCTLDDDWLYWTDHKGFFLTLQ